MQMPCKLEFMDAARESLKRLTPELNQEAMLLLRVIASNAITGNPAKGAEISAYNLPESARMHSKFLAGGRAIYVYFDFKDDTTITVCQVDSSP